MRKVTTYILFSVAFVGLLISLFYSQYYHRQLEQPEILETQFNKQLAEVNEVINVNHSDAEKLLSEVDPNQWHLEIWQGGNLVFWNSPDKITNYAFRTERQINGDSVLILGRFNNIGVHLYRDYPSKGREVWYATDNQLSHSVRMEGLFQSYEIVSDVGLKRSQNIALISYLLIVGFFFHLLSNVSLGFSKWISYAAVILTTLVGVLVPIENFVDSLIPSKKMANIVGWPITIVDLLVVTAGVMGLAFVFARRKSLHTYRPVSITLLGFLTSALLLSILKFAKEVASHPSIQLEIDRIFKFDKYSIIVLVCLALMTLSHLIISIYALFDAKALAGAKNKPVLPCYLGGVLISIVVYYTLDLKIPILLLYIYMVSLHTMIDLFIDTQKKNITWLIWWIMTLSAFLSVAVFHVGLTKSREVRSNFVADFFKESNAEILQKAKKMDEVIRESDLFDKIASPPFRGMKFDKKDILSYIASNLSTEIKWENQFDIDLQGFDNYGNNIFANQFAFDNTFDKDIYRSRQISDYLYFNPVKGAYIIKYELIGNEPDDLTILYVILNMIHEDQVKMQQDLDFNYVIYKDSIPVYIQWVNQRQIDPVQLWNIVQPGNTLKGYEVDQARINGMSIIAYKKISGLIKPVSLFSYLFTLFGLIVLVFALANARYSSFREPIQAKYSEGSSLRNKIQLGVIFLVLFAFVIIGLITTYYFNNVIENTNNKSRTEQTVSILHNVESVIRPSIENLGAFAIVNNKLDEIATIHSKPLALYETNGDLYNSIEEDKFSDRVPFDKMKWLNNASGPSNSYGVLDEDLQMSYVPLYHNSVKPFAILAIAHDSNLKTSRNILDFLSTILNVYVFLFLLAGAIAIIIANSITRPLTVLGQKLKEFKLGRSNEPLVWKSKDEIGELIKDYNNLIIDLEKSADIIAMTERDTAWREMAKQVAHEIKNPLTPMKLSIQYLKRALESSDDAEANHQLIDRVSATLIEQIENLTQIANEFSNFAAMPMASNEKLRLNDIVEMIHELFRKREDMDIHLVEPITDLYVYADKNHLIRILNNILKNAIQAIPTDRRGEITISLYQKEDAAIIKVRDNGTGIPDDKKHKVFTPNFTTKSSGTGLGLAISVNMIEAFNGRIYFETEVGIGTSFFVEIPLMRLSDYKDGITRVILE